MLASDCFIVFYRGGAVGEEQYCISSNKPVIAFCFVFFFLFFVEKYSFGNILAQYELWVQNVSDSIPSLECKDQQKFMSDYQFETDKVENAPQTFGDGGYLEVRIIICNLQKVQRLGRGLDIKTTVVLLWWRMHSPLLCH